MSQPQSSVPRVLIIAEAANPEWVSVPLVGWSMATALARATQGHIVTQVRNRDAFLRAGLVEGRDFTAIDSERLAAPMWALAARLRGGQGVGWTTLSAIASLTYPYFEWLIWRRFGAELRAGRWDIVHRVTPLSPTAPSLLAGRCRRAGVPFVLGPLNGGVPWPPGFDAERRREREWLSYVRGAYRWLPGLRGTWKHAAAILCGSRHTRSEVPAAHQARCHLMPENAIDPARFTQRATPWTGEGPLRLVFLGRLVPYKGPDMLLEAAAPLLADGRLHLTIAGDGPLMPALRQRVATAGLGDAVALPGWVPHAQVQDLLASAHVMALPSVREFGGGVVLEAMAVGVVPLVVDYAGPGELVDDEVGYKVALGTRPQIVDRLRQCLLDLTKDVSGLAHRSHAGWARVQRQHTWDARARDVVGIYRGLQTHAFGTDTASLSR